MTPEGLVVVAVIFAMVTGANDGGALIAPGLRMPMLSVAASITLLTVAVVGFPLLIGASVAGTLGSFVASDAEASEMRLVLATGFVVAVVVVVVLTRRSLPTSLTLAVIGGVAGIGAGRGMIVDWPTIMRVLLIGLAAPVLGAMIALAGSWAWKVVRNASYLRTVRTIHAVAFAAQCVAYGANDGQKIWVLFLASGTAAGYDTGMPWWVYLMAGVAFAAGAVSGLPRLARSVGAGIISARPTHIVTAEISAAAAVLAGSAGGAPVSMTQAIAGGLFGAGLHESHRRVRWIVVRNLVLAWTLTLPTSFGIAALCGSVLAGRLLH